MTGNIHNQGVRYPRRDHTVVWDPTEPAATRPLLLQTPSGWFTYSFDQAKNVTELFDSAGGIAAAYDHGPFGEDMAATGPAAGLNPFRFSSEVWDGTLVWSVTPSAPTTPSTAASSAATRSKRTAD